MIVDKVGTRQQFVGREMKAKYNLLSCHDSEKTGKRN